MDYEQTDDDSPESKLLDEARKRFKLALEAEGKNRDRALEAIKFRSGEQWPDKIKNDRENDPEGARPCLVLDKLNQYINQVKNDQRQNKPSIKVRPVDDGGDKEVAEVFQGIIRHIEDASNAEVAYDTAFEAAVDGGFGYWRIVTEYADELSFDQDIRIKRVRNRFSVLLDPERQEADGSDAKFAFVFEKLTRDEFEKLYPDAEIGSFEADGKLFPDWCFEDGVIVAEYFHVEPEDVAIVLLQDGTIMPKEEYEAENAPSEAWLNPVLKKQVVKERTTQVNRVKWCKLTYSEVLEEKEWAGKYIPIVEVVGNELDIQGERVLSGLVWSARDAQRMYNYGASAFVETVALAPKAPWVAEEGQIEGYEEVWRTSNRRNLAVLPYKARLEDGTLVPAPQRQPMPGVPVGWQQVLGNMEHDIQGSIGMYNASLGERSNEKSGRAILARQREGDVATFHFIDNLSRSMRHTGRILIDLIPKIYDTARIARILGEDGESEAVALDPSLPVPVQRQRVVDERGQESIKKIYNLGVGRYDVTITVGPAYTTKRQEAAEAMIQVVQASPNLMSIIGDLMFRNMDWPGADEVAERLKAMLPPQLKDENQDPRLAKAVQMIQALQAQLKAQGQSMQAEEMRIKAFEAMTKRMSAVSEARLDEAKIREIAAGVVQDILSSITPQPLPAVMGGF